MKRILRNIFIQIGALYFTSVLIQGMEFKKGLISLFITGAFLSISSFVVKPVVNVLLLPLNLVTLNFFRWVGNLVVLYLATLVLTTEFSISAFKYDGFSSTLFDIPQIVLYPGILSFVAFAFVISIIAGIFHWLVSSH